MSAVLPLSWSVAAPLSSRQTLEVEIRLLVALEQPRVLRLRQWQNPFLIQVLDQHSRYVARAQVEHGSSPGNFRRTRIELNSPKGRPYTAYVLRAGCKSLRDLSSKYPKFHQSCLGHPWSSIFLDSYYRRWRIEPWNRIAPRCS